jgi:hypothetical protein
MNVPDIQATVKRLCEVSREDFANPFLVDWPEQLDPETDWYTSPELISLYGTPEYEELSEQQRKRLSFCEAINFYSLNIHGEKSLIEGLAHRLYRKESQVVSPYLHHFLDEENKHMVYFGGFCMRYAGKVYPERKMMFPREFAPGEEDFLFFTRVMIFEEIVDVYNVRMSLDQRLAPIARQINAMHHRDEARHLVFGRKLVRSLFEEYKDKWEADTLALIRDYIAGYIRTTWKEYYNADVYKDAGLANPFDLRDRLFESEVAINHRKAVTGSCLKYLRDTGILLEEPKL